MRRTDGEVTAWQARTGRDSRGAAPRTARLARQAARRSTGRVRMYLNRLLLRHGWLAGWLAGWLVYYLVAQLLSQLLARLFVTWIRRCLMAQ